MPQAILTDSRVTKKAITTAEQKGLPLPLQIKTLPIPKKTPVYYADKHPDAGRGLILKVDRTGSKIWALTYYDKGKQYRLALDPWPGMGPAAARIAAGDIRDEVRKGNNPLVKQRAKKQADIEAEATRLAKGDLTLGCLLLAYVEQLKYDGKYSARAIENSLRKHVERAFPAKWNTPADELVMPDFKDIVGRLTKDGKRREAAKVRAYLRAAYVVGIDAENDPSVVASLQKFKLSTNPVRDLKAIKKRKTRRAERKDQEEGKRKQLRKPLTLPELRLYYQRIKALPSPTGPILLFNLLTGGQRFEQLRRLTVNDLDTDEDVVTFYDPKGRREEERPHEIPLIPEAVEALEAIGEGPNLISFDGGATQAVAWDISKAIKAVAVDMLAAEEVTEMFTGKTIRSTVETRLAAAGVDKITRAYLQSHGLGGVQATSYDFYDYMTEKVGALNKLHDLLNADTADVVPMRRKSQS